MDDSLGCLTTKVTLRPLKRMDDEEMRAKSEDRMMARAASRNAVLQVRSRNEMSKWSCQWFSMKRYTVLMSNVVAYRGAGG